MKPLGEANLDNTKSSFEKLSSGSYLSSERYFSAHEISFENSSSVEECFSGERASSGKKVNFYSDNFSRSEMHPSSSSSDSTIGPAQEQSCGDFKRRMKKLYSQ